MKKKNILIICMLGSLMLAACNKTNNINVSSSVSNEEVNNEEINDEEVNNEEVIGEKTKEAGNEKLSNEEKNDNISDEMQSDEINITQKEIKDSIKNDNGDTLIELTANIPEIKMSDSAVADKINAYFENQILKGQATASEFKEDANERCMTDMEQYGVFTPYEISINCNVTKCEGNILSVMTSDYSYLGGAHGFDDTSTANFNLKTGELYTFADIVNDNNEGREFVYAFMREELGKDEYKDMLFDNYESYIPDLLQDDTWYFDDKGFNIIINEYSIAPYAAGKITLTISYDEFKKVAKEL